MVMSDHAYGFRNPANQLDSAQFCAVDRARASAAEFGIDSNGGLKTK